MAPNNRRPHLAPHLDPLLDLVPLTTHHTHLPLRLYS
jgi:hypothetical protein